MFSKPIKMKNLSRYWPLFCLFLISMLSASAISINPVLNQVKWMEGFMGFIFCQFAMLKLFNIRAFAKGFSMYDLIASRLEIYAFLYPIIELLLGLGYLSGFNPKLVYLITVIVMAVSAVGVVKALKKKLDVRCACMGTILDVPLSTVTLVEDIVMGLMALFLLSY